MAAVRLADYNREIPHDGLGGLTPKEFRQQNDPATLGYVWRRLVGESTQPCGSGTSRLRSLSGNYNPSGARELGWSLMALALRMMPEAELKTAGKCWSFSNKRLAEVAKA